MIINVVRVPLALLTIKLCAGVTGQETHANRVNPLTTLRLEGKRER